MKKPAKPWKPVPVAVQVTRHKKALAAAAKKVHASKAASAKRSAAAKKAAATRAKHRKWSPDEDVALCSARAVAESLRLALGVAVADGDVLALYWLVAGDADAGASILDVLRAAQQFTEMRLERDRVRMHPVARLHFDEALALVERCPVIVQGERNPACELLDGQFGLGHTLIIGLDLPYGEPHAVAVAPDGTWWSWGEPHSPADFPGAVIEEAWAVSWA